MELHSTLASRNLRRNDHRVIIHFDYDCFYASVVEAENPGLKTLPLAIQQKHIIVTCNYEARKRGLHKLQLMSEVKKACPEVIIVVGEDLTRFRDASKALYNFLRSFSWNDKVERLGFDEVWMDVTDIVDYNESRLQPGSLREAFFCTSRNDPSSGFAYDATNFAGFTYPSRPDLGIKHDEHRLELRLRLGSHFALYLRHQLEAQKGYTATAGISTSKLLSKLVGNTNKPRGQTTLIPPYNESTTAESHVSKFMDTHEIGRVPGIGFKLAQKIRAYAGHPSQNTFMENPYVEHVGDKTRVGDVRLVVDPALHLFESLFEGPGQPKSAGKRVYGLLHGIDDAEVYPAKNVPSQISIEDSFRRLDSMEQLLEELKKLCRRLIERMRIDLVEASGEQQVWIGRPKSLRLSTRPRETTNADGTRARAFRRISRSTTCPHYLFNLESTIEELTERLVSSGVMPLFRRIHPEKRGWNLSLVNVAVTDIEDCTSSAVQGAAGRGIQEMLHQQTSTTAQAQGQTRNSESEMVEEGNNMKAIDSKLEAENGTCQICQIEVPTFARAAHESFHSQLALRTDMS